ncbi:mitosis inhibitor protein kinase SWE1 [Histoplasma capsulatum]|uniref:Mitosis inhibitor protein kinase SWE1 n=1 Tax=Ajellomyces capsulatus TaxID=5037 RepID=A0A8A1MGU2_AJECA|nr:mitosis inhibitor protein kinase SWE1 [Histoplasma capsulatum]
MVASFSPHREAGGTLHLPSPNGIHVNPSVAIKQLRRSLSRSPSKGSDFRLLARPNSPSKHTHYISSPLSPSRRASQGNLFLVSANSLPSPLAVPYPPSARINRPGIRRTTSFQPPRSRTTPSSPAKRVLLDSRDSGNSITSPLVVEKSEEPVPPLQLSPTEITSTPELACAAYRYQPTATGDPTRKIIVRQCYQQRQLLHASTSHQLGKKQVFLWVVTTHQI